MWAAIAILGALRVRERGGVGPTHVETSLYETAVNWVPYQLVGYFASGRSPEPLGSGVSIIAPYEAFEVVDGWVMVAAGNDRLFRKLCDALEVPELSSDERFLTNADRVRNRVELAELLRGRVAGRTSAALVETLQAAGVPVAPVLDLAGVAERRASGCARTRAAATHRSIAGAPRRRSANPVDGKRIKHRAAPPGLGEHSRAVLERRPATPTTTSQTWSAPALFASIEPVS